MACQGYGCGRFVDVQRIWPREDPKLEIMPDSDETGIWQPSSNRLERIKELSLSPADFSTLTGSNIGFSPVHAKEWMIFWQTDICEKDEFHSCFPRLSLAESRRVWIAMEEHFFGKYDRFLRVWPEWGSSGIWAPPYPGSRASGGMVDYQFLPLSAELVQRFEAWQAEYDDSPPGGPNEPEWDRFFQTAERLSRDLKQCVGPRIYVERRELIEVLPDGNTRNCRPLLGLPEDN